jgi:uncharacterized protein (DUF433 family)
LAASGQHSKLHKNLEITSLLSPNNVIIRDRETPGGPPFFRGRRVPFQAHVDDLEGGQTLDEFLDDFPTVSREAAVHALEHAKALLVSELG